MSIDLTHFHPRPISPKAHRTLCQRIQDKYKYIINEHFFRDHGYTLCQDIVFS